jgi:hypothetical protein
MGGGGIGSGNTGSSPLKPKWPNDNSQIKHIFSSRKGHISDTPDNRKLLESIAVNKEFLVGMKQKGGSELFVKTLENGKQAWVEVRRGLIQDGGVNDIPRSFWPGLE